MKTTLAMLLLVALIIIALALVTGFIHIPANALDSVSQNNQVPLQGLEWFAQWF